MSLLISIYNRDGICILDPDAFTQKATNLVFSSSVPGGFRTCTFDVPAGIRRDLVIRNAYRLVIRYGMSTCWEGRIEEIEHGLKSAKITAFGLWQHLAQRRASYTSTINETARALIIRLCRLYSPIVGGWFHHVQDPGLNLLGIAWKDASLQRIFSDLMDMGDSGDYRTSWLFNVWDSVDMEDAGDSRRHVIDGKDDAFVVFGPDGSVMASSRHDTAWLDVGGIPNDESETGIHAMAGIRFQNVDVLRYANIRKATLTLHTNPHLPPAHTTLRLFTEAVGNAEGFAERGPETRLHSYAMVDWELTPMEPDREYEIDVTTIVQEVIDDDHWRPNNAIAFLLTTKALTGVGSIEAFDAGQGHEPRLYIDYGPPPEATMKFPPYFGPKPRPTRDTAQYLIFTTDVESGMSVVQTTDGLYNVVRAKYANSLITQPAEDAESIRLYDRRENDPNDLDAGSTADEAKATQLRDLFLKEHKEPKWRTETLTLKSVRDHNGHPVPLATVRAGSVFRIMDLPTFVPEKDSCFLATEVEYNADSGTLTVRPDQATTVAGTLGESAEGVEQGPYTEVGTIFRFDKDTYLADVQIGGSIVSGIPVAHDIGWWLPVLGASCYVMFQTIDRRASSGVVTSVFRGRPQYDPRFHPKEGHTHDGSWEGGGHPVAKE